MTSMHNKINEDLICKLLRYTEHAKHDELKKVCGEVIHHMVEVKKVQNRQEKIHRIVVIVLGLIALISVCF